MSLDKFITNLNRVLLLLLCIGVSSQWAALTRRTPHGASKSLDFGVVYYSARCAIERKDPYDPRNMLREIGAVGEGLSASSAAAELVISRVIYPPTAFLAFAPLAVLHWRVALFVWLGLVVVFLVLAALAMWDLAADAPVVAGSLAGFVLLNCGQLLVTGNPIGIVAPFCAIAAWCFLKRRLAIAGALMLAVALAIKPHDAGFVWLYFLLSGGMPRRWALRTLAIVAVMGICAAVWVEPISPHWVAELRNNLAVLSARGGPADPGPMGASSRTFSPILSLQSTLSVFKDDPRFYNPASYLIGGGLIVAWGIAVLRRRSTTEGALLALAAISILTMLPVYHRADDAKLLLLVVPACAMLWRREGQRRWVALGLTSAAVFVTSAFPIVVLTFVTRNLSPSLSSFTGKLALLLLQPAPVVLLATGCFYLWVFLGYEQSAIGAAERGDDAVNAARATAGLPR